LTLHIQISLTFQFQKFFYFAKLAKISCDCGIWGTIILFLFFLSFELAIFLYKLVCGLLYRFLYQEI